MSSTYFVRSGADTTEVEADNYDDAEQQAAEEFGRDPDLFRADDIEEYRTDGEFNELHTDVYVTINGEGEWTGELVIQEDDEYGAVLREIDYVDEVGLFGAYFSGEMYGTFEKEDVTILIRGGVQDGDEYCSAYVVDSHGDL